MQEPLPFRYPYAQCMVMKLGMAHPDPDAPGKSRVLLTFEDALAFMEKIDRITLGVQKIYYLVGWQYLGHDDKYPDFFEVNEALKRPCDKTAYDSFRWLCESAARFHSVVSVHINFNDAYRDAPSFPEFVRQNALIRGKNGKPRAVERYNGKPCYKTCLKAYWESGLFCRMFDRFLAAFPFLAKAGTIHVDNFQCYKNQSPAVSVAEMQQARREMILYAHKKGVDITSEFTYKETEDLPTKPIFGLPRNHRRRAPMAALGLIPMSWWLHRMTRRELVNTPASLYCGGEFREKRYDRLLYGNMHGEDIVLKNDPDWARKFARRFALYQVPYHFLNRRQRLRITGAGPFLRCTFDGGVVTASCGARIWQNGVLYKDGDTVFLPFVHRERTYVAYSERGTTRTWPIEERDARCAEVYAVGADGETLLETLCIADGRLTLTLPPQTLLRITCPK